MMNPISVAIQAGGQSSRMGSDKSFVLFEGRPLIETVLAQVSDLGQELFIVTNNPEPYAYLGVPTVGDIYPDHGPLGGIFTAVSHAAYPHTLVVACDMPWLERPLLQYLISLRHTADVVVPLWDKFPEPLHALYSKACLPPIEANLQAQQLKITRFFGQVTVRYVKREEIEKAGGNGRSFANINTPQDLTQAQQTAEK
jgi:molybdopterin-guanine dinucleotide biosynthesis protein A